MLCVMFIIYGNQILIYLNEISNKLNIITLFQQTLKDVEHIYRYRFGYVL